VPGSGKGKKNYLMSKTLKVLLLTNYRKDGQRSMLRFGELLSSGLSSDSIECNEIFPEPRLLPLTPTSSLKKWSGYVDKYIIFPRRLTKFLNAPKTQPDLLHIIDHSNAVYMNRVSDNSKTKRLLTCHDLIALRMSKNEFPDAPRISKTGKKLQNWIHRSLSIADAYACDSSATQTDLRRLVPHSEGRSEVIHLGVEPPTSYHSNESSLPFNFSETDYLLHVGSSAWYKNRKAVIESFVFARSKSGHQKTLLVLVGPQLQPEEISTSAENWTKDNPDQIIVLKDLNESMLKNLYKHAKTLIFPSFAEGFGWPPLEARALGCPVIVSKTGAMEEILKGSATYVDPNNQKEINQAVLDILGQNRPDYFPTTIPTIQDCAQNYTSLYLRTIKHSQA
jgi:glycosyltransferase involved in cell wall biosynthesis